MPHGAYGRFQHLLRLIERGAEGRIDDGPIAQSCNPVRQSFGAVLVEDGRSEQMDVFRQRNRLELVAMRCEQEARLCAEACQPIIRRQPGALPKTHQSRCESLNLQQMKAEIDSVENHYPRNRATLGYDPTCILGNVG